MNIIDAIKSGRRFKRKSQPNQGYLYQAGAGVTFYEDDILADDWEVEQTPVTITREQFDKAFHDVSVYYAPILRDVLAKELGL